MNDKIYIIPTQDKPVKIIFEELPCPICSQIGSDFRCKYAKGNLKDLIYTISCTTSKCDNIEYILSKLSKLMQDEINKDIEELFTSSTTSSLDSNKPFTIEDLEYLQILVKPYNDKNTNLYNLDYLPVINFESEHDTYKYLTKYGIGVKPPTKIIYINQQTRKHKKKRINKKWAKRYGFTKIRKEVPGYFINDVLV